MQSFKLKTASIKIDAKFLKVSLILKVDKKDKTLTLLCVIWKYIFVQIKAYRVI